MIFQLYIFMAFYILDPLDRRQKLIPFFIQIANRVKDIYLGNIQKPYFPGKLEQDALIHNKVFIG